MIYFKLIYIENGETKVSYLEDEPINWDKVDIIIRRDQKYFGVNYQYTDGDIQLEFDHVSGVDIIKAVYSRDGNDGNIVLQYGYRKNNIEFIDYEGKLNLNTYKYFKGRVSCTLEKTGFHEIIKSREDTKVDLLSTKTLDGIDKTVREPINLTLHSKPLQRTTIVKGAEYQEASMEHDISGFNPSNYRIPMWFHLPFTEISPNDIKNFYGTGIGIFNYLDYPTDFYFENYSFLDVMEIGAYNFKFHLMFRCSIALDIEHYRVLYMMRIMRNNSLLEEFTLFDSGILPRYNLAQYYTSYTHDQETEIYYELQPGDKIYCTGIIDTGDRSGTGGITISSEYPYPDKINCLEITAVTQMENSESKAMLIKEGIESLLESITNEPDAFRSEYFSRPDGKGSMYSLLNGFFIRNFDTSTRQLSLSWKDLIESLSSIFAIGIGYELVNGSWKIRIEDTDYWFKDVEIIEIDDCSDYEEETAKDLIYNELEIGYEKYPEEGAYILDEFNTKLEFLTPIKTNKNKLSLKSKLIASGYAIEETRREQFESNPADSTSYDDEGFIIKVRWDEAEEKWESEKIEDFSVQNVIGSLNPYNLAITPKRNLLRWARWINGALTFKKGIDVLKNTFFKCNGETKTKASDETQFIRENDDIALNDFDGRKHYFKPTWISFKCRLSLGQIRTIINALNGVDETRKNGYITVNNGVESVQGWLWEMNYNYTKEEVTVKLLKKDYVNEGQIATCSDYADYTFGMLETTAAPEWIEDCIFANFN